MSQRCPKFRNEVFLAGYAPEDRIVCPNCQRQFLVSKALSPSPSPAPAFAQSRGHGRRVSTAPQSRHGCLTAWLTLLIIGGALGILFYIVLPGLAGPTPLDIAPWEYGLGIASGMFQIICVLALLSWKRWGFWGLCVLSAVNVIVALLVRPQVAAGTFGAALLGLLILYGLLHIGKENKAWPQLE